MVTSPTALSVTAADLTIRSLSAATDSALITGSDVDIRNLSGGQDSLKLHSSATAEDSESGSLLVPGTRTFLTKDISAYESVSYLVINGGVAVTVSLEIAPVDSDDYYETDGSSFVLIAYGKVLLTPSKLTQYARVRMSALALATATVYFFAQA